MADTVLKILIILVTGFVAFLGSTSDNPWEDAHTAIWLGGIGACVASLVLVEVSSHKKNFMTVEDFTAYMDEEREHDRLIDNTLKVLLRQQLVSEYRTLMHYGNADDAQRRTWESMYQTYIVLCQLTGDKNHVIDEYREGIENLPMPSQREA